MINTRAHVFVSGCVQGVCFRYYTREQARVLGVRGWVRNCYDGRVEAVIEGEQELVQRLVDYMKEGPESARVINSEVSFEEYLGEFSDFDIASSN